MTRQKLLELADHYDWLGSIAVNDASMAEDDLACIEESKRWHNKADLVRAKAYKA